LPYLLQVQHYMFVTGAPLADIAVLWMNRTYPELAIYTVEANADLHDKMLAKLTEFWHGVQNGIPPAPVCTDDAKALWQKPTGEEALADDDALEAWSKYHEVRAKIEQLKQEEDAAKLQLMESMQTASYLRRGTKLLATWHRNKDSTRIDAAKLRTKYPEIAEECSYVTPGPRVLRVQSDERTG
jgi:predicted phage-related endonuclease